MSEKLDLILSHLQSVEAKLDEILSELPKRKRGLKKRDFHQEGRMEIRLAMHQFFDEALLNQPDLDSNAPDFAARHAAYWLDVDRAWNAKGFEMESLHFGKASYASEPRIQGQKQAHPENPDGTARPRRGSRRTKI